MNRLVGWNPKWYHPGESLWSVANKLAFATCASVADVLRILAGVVERCREGWLFPSADQAVSVCEDLGLPLRVAKGQLFADVQGLPSLQEREHWKLGIRYCPQCLDGFVHRTVFQDTRVLECPVHRTPLLEGCPACKSAIDPACGAPWSCAFCGMVLAVPGRAWIRQFGGGPGLKAVPALAPAPAASSPLGMPAEPLRRWVAQIAYEEHSAIWSTLLGPHAQCARKDMDVCNVDMMPTPFTCPVAGAAWLSAKLMGIVPQFSSGAWAPKVPRGASGLGAAVFLVVTLPPDAVDGAVRALVRQWTLGLLEAFVTAAEAGKSFADWPGPGLSLPAPDPSIYGRLEALTDRAGRKCGFSRAADVPQLEKRRGT